MLIISSQISIPIDEIEVHATRAQGAGGQNVNKVSSAIHLRFDIKASSLPESCKEALLNLNDGRLTTDGVVVIKAQTHRSQDKNRDDALERLRTLILSALVVRKQRRATKPTKGSQRRRIDSKVKRGQLKASRGRIDG